MWCGRQRLRSLAVVEVEDLRNFAAVVDRDVGEWLHMTAAAPRQRRQ